MPWQSRVVFLSHSWAAGDRCEKPCSNMNLLRSLHSCINTIWRQWRCSSTISWWHVLCTLFSHVNEFAFARWGWYGSLTPINNEVVVCVISCFLYSKLLFAIVITSLKYSLTSRLFYILNCSQIWVFKSVQGIVFHSIQFAAWMQVTEAYQRWIYYCAHHASWGALVFIGWNISYPWQRLPTSALLSPPW